MTDQQALALFQVAAKLVSDVPNGISPMKVLKFHARRITGIPDNPKLFGQEEMIIMVATIYPTIYCLRKVVSWDQIRLLIDKMEEGEKSNASDNSDGPPPSEDSVKPN